MKLSAKLREVVKDRLLLDAADELDRLGQEVKRLVVPHIHSCHAECERLECVQRREIARLKDALHRIAMPNHRIVYCRDGHEENVLMARNTLGVGK